MRLFFLAGLCTLARCTIDLPPPPGPCSVQTSNIELTDQSRVDPYRPKQKRALMATTYIPVQCNSTHHDTHYQSYIPPRVAKAADKALAEMGLYNATVEAYRTQVATPKSRYPQPEGDDYPVVIFSHGLYASRFLYTQILEAVASQGIVVVAVDHPHDAAIVEFPGGRTAYASNITTMDQTLLAINTRAQDLIFTLDQLHSNKRLIPPTFMGHLNLNKVSAVGHSLGGATAAQAMLIDTRFAGGINFDGEMFGPVLSHGLDRPFIIFGEDPLVQHRNASWVKFWNHSSGFKPLLQLKHSKHLTFTDIPLLLDSVKPSSKVREAAGVKVGGLAGLRARDIMAEYITAATTFFATGKKSALLSRPSAEYPEVEILR